MKYVCPLCFSRKEILAKNFREHLTSVHGRVFYSNLAFQVFIHSYRPQIIGVGDYPKVDYSELGDKNYV